MNEWLHGDQMIHECQVEESDYAYSEKPTVQNRGLKSKDNSCSVVQRASETDRLLYSISK